MNLTAPVETEPSCTVTIPINRTLPVKTRYISPAEARVLRGIADCKNNQEIADELNVSVKTVETHRAKIYKKAGIENTAMAVHLALYLGLTTGISYPHIALTEKEG